MIIMMRDLGNVIKDLLKIKDGTFAIGNDHSVGEMKVHGDEKFSEENGVIHMTSKRWTIHLDLSGVNEGKFIKQKEPSGTIPYILYLSLRDKEDYSIISFFFPNPWLDINGNVVEFDSNKHKLFESLKNKYIKKKVFTFLEKK